MRFLYTSTCGLLKYDVEEQRKKLFSYKKNLAKIALSKTYAEPECSLALPYDEAHLRAVRACVKQKVKKTLKYIFVIGIGGSNLGTKAVYDALRGYRDMCGMGGLLKMFFLDTVDPDILTAHQKLIASIRSSDELLINIISKSGGTTETILNAEYVYAWLRKKFPNIRERIVVTTDTDSVLWKESVRQHIACLSIPARVGGRYSVLSTVGLFPLATAGFNVSALLAGAREVHKDMAFTSAIVLYLHAKKGNSINDTFFFHPELESLGKWHRQLLAESIGKESGDGTRVGITPTVSLGSIDLHSMGQLYLGGRRDKITTFVYTDARVRQKSIQHIRLFPQLIPELRGLSGEDVMSAIFAGVQAAYAKQSLPYMTLLLPDISECSLGMYLQWKMIETMVLGTLFDVNAFDQPHVELYKKETKRILEKK